MTKISVIIPVYNVEEYLEKSIKSVLDQTFEDIELICVNDGSKDNSLQLLETFAKSDKRIRIINQENMGCGASRNRALDEAIGDYIYFFDPDDYILPNAFEKLYNNVINNDSDLVIFKIARFRDGESIDYSNPGFNLEKNFQNVDFDNFAFDYHDVKRYVLNSSFAPWTKLYKKEFLDKYDDFRFPINLPFDDVPFHVKAMLRSKRISFVPDYFYHYRLSNLNSVNNTSSNGIYIMDIIDIVENFLIEENYFKEFQKEFYLFKVTQIFNYMISSNSEEYFKRAKVELQKVKNEYFDKNLNNDNFINNDYVKKCRQVFKADNYKEYLLDLKLSDLKSENKKLKKINKKLKKENKKLKKINEKLIHENEKLINSRSWKLTAPFRKINK